ncbi:MAG: potassium/proton antiporter [Fimbriimonadaceae bacterium]
MSFDTILLTVAALLALSVFASQATTRLRVPVLVLFVAIGMAAGSDGFGGIWFDNYELAQQIGIFALVCILFSGGMDTRWAAVRPYWQPAVTLATVGVVATALLIGVLAHFMLGFGWLEGLLLGAIISSTDAAAVFMTLRGKGAMLREDVQAVLELESGSNDPMAVFLSITLVDLIAAGAQPGVGLLGTFVWQMAVGLAGGYLVGRGGVLAMRRLRLAVDGLYHVASMAVMLASYSVSATLAGSGFLAAYVGGLAYGNGEFSHKRSLARFHDGLAWLMQVAMFLMLGLLVFPSQLPSVALTSLVVALALMLVARPIGVILCLLPFRIRFRETALLSWTGLRGAVPIILATYPLLAGLDRAPEIFNIVFFVVLLSALVQGPTIPMVAGMLGLARQKAQDLPERPG